MSPAERQAAIDAAAKLGHVIRPVAGKGDYQCACGRYLRMKRCVNDSVLLHCLNAVSLGRKIDAEPQMVAHPRDGD